MLIRGVIMQTPPVHYCDFQVISVTHVLKLTTGFQFIVGDHLQQGQRGVVAPGAAVLPAAGPVVPRLPAGRLQVCFGVPWLFDRTQPRMG